MPKTHWLHLWERLRGSLWLLPTILTVAAFALAEVAVRLDDLLEGSLDRELSVVYPGSAEGARQVLGTLAGSMVSLTTISFSVMMVVLTLAANQFGPRVLRNFLADRLTQTVLGTFVATFVYCVVVLGRVPDPDEIGQVPRLAVTLGLALTLVSLGMLIVFIHHIARSIQASEVVKAAYHGALRAIDVVYPETLGDAPSPATPAPALPEAFEQHAHVVRAADSGYVQAVDTKSVMQFAGEHDAVVRLRVQPGAFLHAGDPVAEVWARRPPEGLEDVVRHWLVTGSERTAEQDAPYALRQLAEIAVRALSPGINDPHTAADTIDFLGSTLARVAGREIPAEVRVDDEGTPRAWVPRPDFPAAASAALDPLLHYGAGHALVLSHLLRLLQTLAPRLRRPEDRRWAEQQCQRMGPAVARLSDPYEVGRLQALQRETAAALQRPAL